MSSRKDKRTGKWYFRKQITVGGVEHSLFGSPYDKKSQADEAERVAIDKLKHPERAPAPTFAEWFNGRFWQEWVLGGPRGANSPAEQESKRSIYKNHLAVFFGSLQLDRIEHEQINAFRAQLRTQDLEEKTINNILAVLSKPLTYAEAVGVILKAPSVGVAKVERPEIEFIEFEEFAELVRAARADREPEYVIALLLAFEAGLRIGEIKALAWSAVDMKARTVTVERQVRPVKVDGRYVETFGPPKGRRRRTVPMSPALYDSLRDRLRRGFVVPGIGNQHKLTSETRSAIERIAKRAGLSDKIGGEWHVGRHTFATHAALLGVNPWLLQEWMGHKRSEETQLYADVARAHGRPIPPPLLAAGADESDPTKRILCMLSARHALSYSPAELQPSCSQNRRRDAK